MAAYRTLPHYEQTFDHKTTSGNTSTCLAAQDVPTPHRCEGNVSTQALTWLDASNGHAFMHKSSLDCQSSIGVNSNDLERTFPSCLELIRRREVVVDTNHAIDLAVKLRTFAVLPLQAQVSLQLPIFRWRTHAGCRPSDSQFQQT